MDITTQRKAKLFEELRRCKNDFWYFLESYLKILSKDEDSEGGYLIRFRANAAQKQIIEALLRNNVIYVLKARKLGSSTIVAAYYFWRCLFTPHFQVLVVAHKRESAKKIFTIYKRFYDNLPKFLQLKTVAASTTALTFRHGGSISCTTSSSDDARGSTPHALHLSEFAHFKDVRESFASIMNSVPDSAMVVRETTANGLNLAYKLWYSNDGVEKVFIPWTTDPKYVSDKRPQSVPARLKVYAKKHALTKPQLWWAARNLAQKQGGNWDLFNQENPIVAEVAFVTSGGRFFNIHFPGIHIPDNRRYEYLGYRRYREPERFRLYTVGVDGAGGDKDRDLSAFVTLDVTDQKNPIICSTFESWLPLRQFDELAADEIATYAALGVCEMTGGWGNALTELLVERGLEQYRRVSYDKIKNNWSEKLGFSTNKATRPRMLSAIHSLMEERMLDPRDDRLRSEMNTFVWRNGKAQAERGEYDDLIMALALAWEGRNQVSITEHHKQKVRPHTIAEMLQWEAQTGKDYKSSSGEGFFDDNDGDDPDDVFDEMEMLQAEQLM